jgi:hypothetical protein
VRLGVAHDPALLGTELTGFAVEELVVDPAIQLIHIHGVDPVLEVPVLMLEFRDRFFVELQLPEGIQEVIFPGISHRCPS